MSSKNNSQDKNNKSATAFRQGSVSSSDKTVDKIRNYGFRAGDNNIGGYTFIPAKEENNSVVNSNTSNGTSDNSSKK